MEWARISQIDLPDYVVEAGTKIGKQIIHRSPDTKRRGLSPDKRRRGQEDAENAKEKKDKFTIWELRFTNNE